LNWVINGPEHVQPKVLTRNATFGWLILKKKKIGKKIEKMKFTESFTGYFFVLWELT